MVRQKAGHVDHFGRRVQADHQFGIRKGVLQRTGRYPHATTHVQNLGIPTGLRVAGHDHPRKPFRDHGSNVFSVVGNHVDDLGADGGQSRVDATQKTNVAKGVDGWIVPVLVLVVACHPRGSDFPSLADGCAACHVVRGHGLAHPLDGLRRDHVLVVLFSRRGCGFGRGRFLQHQGRFLQPRNPRWILRRSKCVDGSGNRH
mmetsp:Transcript_10252/g.21531  ORF Transcript_10252/g.21531 Transcript_10252/m.21531 type:complete len:201 (-) Transcript_10252:1352-1954(-)